MANTKTYFGPKERSIIAAQGKKFSAAEIRRVENEWPKLIAQVKAHLDKKTDPSSPAVQKLAGRWMELIGKFSGCNQIVRDSTANLYRDNGKVLGELFGADRVPDERLANYIQKALASKK